MDRYEAAYNFRYEDGTGAFVPSHSRTVEESLRIKENQRKEKRKEHEQRKKEDKVWLHIAIFPRRKRSSRCSTRLRTRPYGRSRTSWNR